MARQGRCVAKAGVRDAARAARKHAETWVCPPASCSLPPLRSASLSPAPLPLPGVRRPRADSGRRAGPAGRWRVSTSGAVRRAAFASTRSEEGVPVVAVGLRSRHRQQQVHVRGRGLKDLEPSVSVPCDFEVRDPVTTPVYQVIAAQAAGLRARGQTLSAIARRFRRGSEHCQEGAALVAVAPGTSGNLVKPCRFRPQPRAPNASKLR